MELNLKGNKGMKRYTQTDKRIAEWVLKYEETGDAEKALLQKLENIRLYSIKKHKWS